MSAPAIEVHDLTFRYPGRLRPALKHVSFSIPTGGALLLLGPSGCGKSTLALTLNGAIPHFVEGELQGEVRIDGRATRRASMAEMAQRVGIVFQDPEAQFTMLTVEEEVAFGLENLAVPRAEMEARIVEALRWVGLEDRRRERIEWLSGGQKQRLALASVLAQKPRVLVFDEPTAQLDPAGAADVLALLRQLRSEGHYTLVIVEHRLDDLMPLIDDVLVLSQSGEVVTQGPPRQVMRDRNEWLSAAGVWVPQVSELATRLAGLGVRLDPFPLTVSEAVQALGSPDHFPASSSRGPGSAAPATDRTPFIEIDHLTFAYPRAARPALRDVSVTFDSGVLVALVGANGAGKTTLARHSVGILDPPVGRVRLMGADLSRMSAGAVARIVGYVFQNPEHQFVGLTVLDDVAFGLRHAGRSEQDALRQARAMLAQFGLSELAEAHPYSLSHGEQRRLSVAAMLVLGQRGLFLDEPTFGQDRLNADHLLDRVVALGRDGRTMVAITHDMRLVAERSARAVAMSDGRIIFDGPPAVLFDDASVLRQAQLRPPPLVEVAQLLGVRPLWLGVSQAVDSLGARRIVPT